MRSPIFRLQYASNLFVDLHKRPFEKMAKPTSSSLALLGNIGRPEDPKTYHFLNYCAKNWDKVFWIPGPHELTNKNDARMTFSEKVQNAQALCNQFKTVSLMDSKEAVFHEEKVVLLGTPLWTHLVLPPKRQPEFSTIFTSVDEAGPIPLCHHVRNHWYKQDTRFLAERSLFWNIVHPDIKLVYLTHTLPTAQLVRSPQQRMRMDVLDSKAMFSPVAWLGGASGATSECASPIYSVVNGLYEYPFKGEENTHYDPTAVLEIKADTRPPSLPRFTLPPLLSSLVSPKPFLVYA
jgi:hypothetical protein